MTAPTARDSNCLRFLHISDLHFNTLDNDHLDPFADIRNQLQRDLSTLVERIGPVDAILVGGDIAHKAHKVEYQRAGKWFDDLCQQVNLPVDRLFVVPGNHDVDRQIASNYASIRDAHLKLRSCQIHNVDSEIRTYFRDQEDKNRLFRAIEEYNIFAQTYGCQFDAEKPYWEYIFPFASGIKLILRGINSTLVSNALDSDESEKLKLVIGKGQATCENKTDSIYMVMCHHPPSWLRDRSDIESILNSRATIQLYGHIHEFQTETGGLGKSLKIQAGAVQPDLVETPFSPCYNLIQLDLNLGEPQTLNVQVWSRTWNPNTHGFRADFTDAGAEYLEVQLPVQVSPQIIPTRLEQPILSDTITSSEEQAQTSEFLEVTTLDKIRKIQYRLNKLHFPDFLEIAGSLNLINDEDERVSSGRDLKSIVFTRAAKQHLLYTLWELTSEKLALDEENPFSSEVPK
jgi:calcineurin-like phosphoesterase family protein